MHRTLFILLMLLAGLSGFAYNVSNYEKVGEYKEGNLEYTVYYGGQIDRDNPEVYYYAILSDARDYEKEELRIPHNLYGYARLCEVVGIKEYALKDNLHIKKVEAEGNTGTMGFEIQKCAFQGCKNLKTVILKNCYLRDDVFKDCEALENVDCSEGIPTKFPKVFADVNTESLTINNGILCADVFSGASINSLTLIDCQLSENAIDAVSNLETVSFDSCKFPTSYVVESCSRLKRASFRNTNGKNVSTLNKCISNCPALSQVNLYDILEVGKIVDDNSAFKTLNMYISPNAEEERFHVSARCRSLNVYFDTDERTDVAGSNIKPKWEISLTESLIENVIVKNPYAVIASIDYFRTPRLREITQSLGYVSEKMFCNFNFNPLDIFRSGPIYHVGSKAFYNCGEMGEGLILQCYGGENGCDIYADIFSESEVSKVSILGNVRFHNGTFGKIKNVYVGDSVYPLALIGMIGDEKGGFSGSEIKELCINRELTTASSNGFDQDIHAFAEAKVGTLILKNLTSVPENALMKGEFNIVDFDRTVERIESGNLEGAKSINTVICRAGVPPILSIKTPDSILSDILIIVPKESIDTYKNAEGWRDFSRFEALENVSIEEIYEPSDEPSMIYTLDGRRMAESRNPLPPGIYIKRSASGKTTKIAEH